MARVKSFTTRQTTLSSLADQNRVFLRPFLIRQNLDKNTPQGKINYNQKTNHTQKILCLLKLPTKKLIATQENWCKCEKSIAQMNLLIYQRVV